MNKFCVVIFSLLIGFSCVSKADAHLLRVGYLADQAPYTDIDNQVKPGIAIELWQWIAYKHDWQYQLIKQTGTIDQAIDDLAAGKIDVLLGGFYLTPEQMNKVTFSRPYLIVTVGVLTKQQHVSMLQIIKELIGNIFSLKFLIPLLLVVLLVHILWVVEKGRQVPKHYWTGIRKSLWLSSISILTSYPEYEVKGTRAKIVSILMILLALILSSLLFGLFSSTFILSLTKDAPINNLANISHKPVAAIAGTANFILATNLGLHVVKVADINAAINLISTDQVAGLVIDIPTVKAYLNQHAGNNLVITPIVLKQYAIAIAFAYNSKIVQTFNYDLVHLQSNYQMIEICSRYLPAEQAQFCGI